MTETSSSTKDCFIFYASNVPHEVGFAAFLALIDDKFITFPFTPTQARNREYVMGILEHKNESPYSILFIGTYWISCMKDIIDKYNPTSVTVYSPGESPGDDDVNCVYINGTWVPWNVFILNCVYINGTLVPWDVFIPNYLKETNVSEQLIESYCGCFSGIIKMLSDHSTGSDIMKDHIFFTGLYNIGLKKLYEEDDLRAIISAEVNSAETLTLYERFSMIFLKKIEIQDVMEIGERILRSQIHLVCQRVINNSKLIELQDGTQVALMEATELVNLTHMALQGMYGVKISIVISMKLRPEIDEFAYSIRSTSDEHDAQKIIRGAFDPSFSGEGNPRAAEGRMPFNILIPF